MEPGPDEAELLQYLADLGWSDLYLQARSGAPSGAQAPETTAVGKEAEAFSKGAASVASAGSSRAVPGKHPDAASPAGDAHAVRAPRGIGPAVAARRPDPEVVAELAALAEKVASCRECKLCTTRTQTVFASGDPGARLMVVGEGPGAEEDRQGLPFVGAAGELLNKILAAIGLAREEVYVANIVKCRPPGNRDPEPDEVRACRGYLETQIALVRPEVLVVLGRVAAQVLLGTDASLSRLRGEWHEVQGVPVRVTYHPAALLRNAAWKRPTWEDMQLVRDRLHERRWSPGRASVGDPATGAGSAVARAALWRATRSCIAIFSDAEPEFARLGGEAARAAKGLAQTLRFTGEAERSAEIPLGRKGRTLTLVGLGKRAELTEESARAFVDQAIEAARSSGATSLGLVLPEHAAFFGEAAAERIARRLALADYRFDPYLPRPTGTRLKAATVAVPSAWRRAYDSGMALGTAIAEGVRLARDLGNTPPNQASPDWMARQARGLRPALGRQDPRARPNRSSSGAKMGGILAVGGGSKNPPRLVRIDLGTSAGAVRSSPWSARESPSTPAASRSSRRRRWTR